MHQIVDNPASFAILGLGEAGSLFAAGLIERGCSVSGWDPDPARQGAGGARAAAGTLDAVRGADVVLSLNWASVAREVAEEVAPALAPGAIYAELNTAAPAVKRDAAASVAGSGASFADVALLAPVPGRGVRTPALASGPGAEAFASVMRPLGMGVETLGEEPGEAAERKLLRSVFFKGMAMAALESLAAARAAGCEGWLRGQLIEMLDGAGEPLLERWIEGSRTHAVRRGAEMEAAAAMLVDLGTPARISEAAAAWHAQLAREEQGV